MVELTDSGPAPPDDIGRKRETPMNTTPDPKETKPHDALIAGADEGLAHAHEQIKRADEQLTRLTEQLARMERDDAHPSSARLGSHEPGPHEPSPQPPPGGRPALLTLVGLSLAACITVAALLALLLSYGDGPTLIVARWAPQPASTPTLPPENNFPRALSATSFAARALTRPDLGGMNLRAPPAG